MSKQPDSPQNSLVAHHRELAEIKMGQISQRTDNHPAAARMIGRLINTQPLGFGGEKVVYIHPHNPNQVMVFLHNDIEREHDDYWDPESLAPEDLAQNQAIPIEGLKARYYLSKLLGLLAPGTVPRIYFAGSQPPMLISEKIHAAPEEEEDPSVRNLDMLELGLYSQENLRKFKEATNSVNQVLRELGIGTGDEGAEGNYVRKEDGSYVFVDTIENFRGLNLDKVHEVISKLSAKDQQKANRLLGKLIENAPEIESNQRNAEGGKGIEPR